MFFETNIKLTTNSTKNPFHINPKLDMLSFAVVITDELNAYCVVFTTVKKK